MTITRKDINRGLSSYTVWYLFKKIRPFNAKVKYIVLLVALRVIRWVTNDESYIVINHYMASYDEFWFEEIK